MKVSKLWSVITNNGIYPHTPKENYEKIQMLNKLVFPVMALQTVIHIQNLIRQDLVQIGMGTMILLLSATIFFLNRIEKNLAARLCLNFLYPVVIFILSICYGDQFRVNFAYIIIIVTTIIFHREVWLRWLLISWSMTLYFMGEDWNATHMPIFELTFSFMDIHVIFVCSVISVITIIDMYMREKEEARLKNEEAVSLITYQNRRLSLANKELERFAYIASHDLKTPLRTIVSYLDLIEKKINKNEYEGINDYFDFVRKGSKQMNTLITEVLEYSKLNINEFTDTEQIDLNEVVSDNLKSLEIFIKEKNAVIVSQSLPAIKANRLMMSILFQNLLENAIRYNVSEVPTVEISVEREATAIQLIFRDNGVGIERQYKDKIFEMFTRLSSTEEGTGMGLAICKKVIQRMNGDIWFESEVNNGSAFFVKIPTTA
jgi:signal transduction histidine kinase